MSKLKVFGVDDVSLPDAFLPLRHRLAVGKKGPAKMTFGRLTVKVYQCAIFEICVVVQMINANGVTRKHFLIRNQMTLVVT